MRTLVEHIERAFPQERLPSPEEIEEFIDGYEAGYESDRQEAAMIKDALTTPFDRRAMQFAAPDFIFCARGYLQSFLLGSFLLTLVDGELNPDVAGEFRDSLLIELRVTLPPSQSRQEDLGTNFVGRFGDLTVYQCCVVAECMRCALDQLEDSQRWHTEKALELYWGVFPPMSRWPTWW